MLTAYAMTPEDIKKSYENGAASFVPKEKMADITTYLTDIYEAREKGKNLWWRWFDRLADYCERNSVRIGKKNMALRSDECGKYSQRYFPQKK